MNLNYFSISHHSNKVVSSIIILCFMLLFTHCTTPADDNSGNENISISLKAESGVDNITLIKILSDRLLSYGIKKENFTIDIKDEIIEVEIRKAKYKAEMLTIFTTQGKVEFWETYSFKELFEYFATADSKISVKTEAEIKKQNENLSKTKTTEGELNINAIEENKEKPGNTLFTYLMPNLINDENGNMAPREDANIGYVKISDTSLIQHYFKREEVGLLFPRDLKMSWSLNPAKIPDAKDLFELYALKAMRENAAFDGSEIAKVYFKESENSTAEINLEMTAEGTRLLRMLTRNNINKQIAICLDDKILFCGFVINTIEDGKMAVSGNFTKDEAESLCAIINGKILPYHLTIISKKVEQME